MINAPVGTDWQGRDIWGGGGGFDDYLLSKRKLDNLFDNSLDEDKVTGFNFSDLVRISEAFNLSYSYMLTGRD